MKFSNDENGNDEDDGHCSEIIYVNSFVNKK